MITGAFSTLYQYRILSEDIAADLCADQNKAGNLFLSIDI